VAWAEAVPNLLIGLREGLEAGLVVSILLAAVRKLSGGRPADQRISTVPIWLGVAAALSVAASFVAVLTFTTSQLSSRTQQGIGGVLSVLAVGLVTAMVFWMRRTASMLSARLRGDVVRAAAIGAGALTVTAFLAVAREGLETTLFMWTAVKAAGSTAAPLLGAAVGLAAAVVLCWLLYRQAMRINLGAFFNWTASALVVLAAGILAYGLGDLQDAGWLPGASWIAFDLSGHVDPNSWWASLITGVTELTPKMTVLQLASWTAYLAVVTAAFVRSRPRSLPARAPAEKAEKPASPGTWERVVAAHMWPVGAALVLIPVAIAAAVIATVPRSATASDIAVSVTETTCAKEWKTATGGSHTFLVDNKSAKAGEITLTDTTGGIVGEIEVIGPATTAPMTAVLGEGSYSFNCRMSGQPLTLSAPVHVAADAKSAPAQASVRPVTVDDLTGPNNRYQDAARAALDKLTADVARIRTDLATNNMTKAKADWLAAQTDWERVGASYNSFGDQGQAVDGLPNGLPNGVNDEKFTGLHRLEYGLFHNQPSASLLPVVDALANDIATVRANLGSHDLAGDPTKLPIRAHEILEDALRDHLSGIDDFGAGAAYPETAADIDITRTVLTELAPLVNSQLVTTANSQLDALQAALEAAHIDGVWQPPSQTPLPVRHRIDGAIGGALETLSAIPVLLEVPPNP
jgi:high-affinity iron transporter